jgi:hypothetical protein
VLLFESVSIPDPLNVNPPAPVPPLPTTPLIVTLPEPLIVNIRPVLSFDKFTLPESVVAALLFIERILLAPELVTEPLNVKTLEPEIVGFPPREVCNKTMLFETVLAAPEVEMVGVLEFVPPRFNVPDGPKAALFPISICPDIRFVFPVKRFLTHPGY